MAQTLNIPHFLSLHLTFVLTYFVIRCVHHRPAWSYELHRERVWQWQYVLISMSFRNWRSLFRAQEIMASLCSHWVPWSATWQWKEQTPLLLLLPRSHKRCVPFYLFIVIEQLPWLWKYFFSNLVSIPKSKRYKTMYLMSLMRHNLDSSAKNENALINYSMPRCFKWYKLSTLEHLDCVWEDTIALHGQASTC